MRLELQDLQLRAGSFSLGPLSLVAGAGEYLVVLGPTGAGKTLTLETIAGLRRPLAGRVLMDARDVTSATPEARRIGYLYQDSLLFPHLSVRANLAYGAHRLARAARIEAIDRIARMLQIDALLSRMPRGLSGGERQRVALARALATQPALLLLDEPMAALDPNSRHALRERLRAMHRELGTTTIHVTHNFAEAFALADRIAILIDGGVRQVGTPAQVLAKPDSAIIARFLKTARLATGDAADEDSEIRVALSLRALSFAFDADASEMPALVGEGAEVQETAGAMVDGDAIAARIVAIEDHGGELAITLNAGIELRARVRAGSAVPLCEGAPIWVRLPRG